MNMRMVNMLAVFCLLLSAATAQKVDSLVRGQVTDPSGGTVADAEVTAKNVLTGMSRRVETNRQGYYVIPALSPSEYEIQVVASGFKKLRQTGIVLAVREQARVDVVLEVGEVNDEVTVSAELAMIELESSAVGSVIPNNYIVNLPLNGRNFLELALLAPGVSPSAQGSAGSARGRLAFQSNGLRESHNSYIYDGVYAVDPVLNSFTLTPPVDAIGEFRVHTSGAEAGFGRNSGGQVAVVLKQGVNRLHGSAYEFFRNDSLDARNFFDDPSRSRPKLRRNQFGFAVGGAVRPNSSFFFVDYEGLVERRAITQTTNVPTAAERAGDFSQSLLGPPIDFLTGQPFPDSQLPFQHPIGAGIASLYPLPNRQVFGQNFVAAPTQRNRNNKFDVRFDQSIGRDGSLTGRYSFGDSKLFEPFATGSAVLLPGYGNDVDERGQNLMIAETHALSTRWLNDFRFGFNRIGNRTFQQNINRSVNQSVGLPDFASRDRDLGLSSISVTGFSPLGDEVNNPQQSTVDSYQILDTASYAQGGHLLQFGFERHWISQDAFRDVLSRGLINFLGAFTQNPMADLLLGLPTFTGGAVSDNPQELRTGNTSFFVHDAWKLRRNLTLNLGLRYEYNTPAHDAKDAAFVYDPSVFSVVPVGQNDVPRGGFADDRNNFAPRAGLAWSPFGSRRTVIRAGYGIHHNFSPLAPGQGIYFNPPLFNFQLFFPSQQGGPITVDNPWPAQLQAPVPPSAFAYDRNLRTSYAQQWNFSFQGEINQEVIVEIGYHGTKGSKLLTARDINQPAPSPRFPNLRPLPFFQSIDQTESSADSIYHSLQTQLQCRFRGGLTGLFSYTWSKSIDNASNYFPSAVDNNFPQDSSNVAAERGLSSFDLRQRFSGSWVYELPLGPGHKVGGNLKGWQEAIMTGWMVNGVMTFQTGQPFTVGLPRELDNSNTGISFLGGAADRPNLIGNPVLGSRDPSRWFATEAFGMPAFGAFGSAGRNILSGPSLRNIDFSLLKDMAVGETAKVQFRAEFFNVFNTPNFRQPNAVFGTAGFGRVLSARAGREVQFGLKFLF